MRTLALIVIGLVLGAAAVPAQAADRSVPRSFVGANADGELTDGTLDFGSELGSMVTAGVESVRVVVDWRSAQPYRRFSDVPPAELPRFRDEYGVPTDWSLMDAIVTEAARRRVTVLPVPLVSPDWAAQQPGPNRISPPKDPRDYTRFLKALIRRYGPDGRFWMEHPELSRMTIRHWQIWNEPPFDEFWPKPWEDEYVALLRASRRTVKRMDPKAEVILAGLPNDSWNSLEKIYDHGGRGQFDALAIHPFTARTGGVVTIAKRTRRVLSRHRDGKKPMYVTELSWTSARGQTDQTFGNETTEEGQAHKVDLAYKLLAKVRRSLRLKRVFWYTWLTHDEDPIYPFDYAGIVRLRNGQIERKPAYAAFQHRALALEACQAKSADDASRCAP